MNRKSLFGRTVASSLLRPSDSRLPSQRLMLEPLEERRLLATVYFNDNWYNVNDPGAPLNFGDAVDNSLDTVLPGTISATYGLTAFGKGDGGTNDTSLDEIHEAISLAGPGDTLHIVGGTYAASDIIIDRALTITGDGTGSGRTLIVPEVTSAKVQENFGAGTRSGFIIYSPSVTIQNLVIDGNGNGALGGSLHFHHGITTLYDTQNGGNYSSLHNGPLPLIVLGPTGVGEGGAGAPNESIPKLLIDNVSVNNTYWHGITISPLKDKNFDAGPDQDVDLQVRNSTITNVGDVKDANRVGLLLQNINDTVDFRVQVNGNAENVTVTGAGVGVKTAPWGDNPSYGSRNTASNMARLWRVTAIDSGVRGFEFLLASRGEAIGLQAHWTNPSNATGVYVNQGVPTLAGLQISNAKIGVHIQNAPLAVQGGAGERHPLVGWGATISGAGAAVPGSVGLLVDNDANSTNPASTVVYWDTEIKNFETGIRIEQKVTPPDPSKKNEILFADPRITNVGKAIIVGNNSIASGSINSTAEIQAIGTGQVRPTMYNWDYQNPFFYLNPGNSGGAAKFATPKADVLTSGSVSFASGTTFSPLLTGDSGNKTLFDFNSKVTYQPSLPPAPPETGIVPTIYGVLFGWLGNVTQDGTGQLNVGGSAKNGYGYDFLFGGNNRPTDTNLGEPAGKYVLLPTDISNNTNVEIVMKLLPNNQSRSLWFGLFDIRGNAYVYTLDMSLLNTSEFTTLSYNMLTPVNDLTGPDSHVDLTTITGYVFGGDNGYGNGLQNVPIGFSVNEIRTSSTPNSLLRVNGTVNLGGATFSGTLKDGYAPTIGETFTIIENDGADAVVGTFAGVPQGGNVTINGLNFTVSYTGGTNSNDVTLTRADVVAPPASIVGRHLFYDESKFDLSGNDGAIAPDKVAYLAGSGLSGAAHVSSYTKGINGIMVDIANLPGTVTANDFSFKVGATATPGTWAAGPAPNNVVVRPGAGVGGSTRVELLWNAGVVKNTWLQVTVEGNDATGGNNTNTGLAASDVFYFGSRIGDSFLEMPPASYVTNATDEIGARTNTGFLQPITRIFDFDKDTVVNANDQIAARTNGGFMLRLNLPAPGPLAAEDNGSSGDNAVASALAASSSPASNVRVPGWISSRLAKVDLNSGPIADLFTRLAEADTPRSRAILTAANRVTDALGLDDSLLESLIDDLGVA